MFTSLLVKLFLENPHDPKTGRPQTHLRKRVVDLSMSLRRTGSAGALRPVEEMAWILRLLKDKLLEFFHSLAEVGVVHEGNATGGSGCLKKQATILFQPRSFESGSKNEVTKRYLTGNAEAEAASSSTSASVSDSFSDSVSYSDSVSREKVKPLRGACGACQRLEGNVFASLSDPPAHALRRCGCGQWLTALYPA